MKAKKTILLFFILIVILFLSLAISALLGVSSKDTFNTIIWQIRIPRIILGLFVGAGLASCGAVLQAMLKNSLAEPYTLGISGAAALGVSIGVVLGVSGLYMSLCAFLGSALSIFLIYAIASRKQFSNSTLILSGVILSFLFSSVVLLIFSLIRSEDVQSTVLWLSGDLSVIPSVLTRLAPFLISLGILILCVFSRDLNILTLGDEKATHLGLNVELTKKIFFLAASFITGVCVSVSGIIGFVGLIIPHIMRRFAGVDNRILIPASAIGGAIFLVLSDALSRIIIRPVELPVGIITGIFGGIFFLVLLLRSKKWEIL